MNPANNSLLEHYARVLNRAGKKKEKKGFGFRYILLPLVCNITPMGRQSNFRPFARKTRQVPTLGLFSWVLN